MLGSSTLIKLLGGLVLVGSVAAPLLTKAMATPPAVEHLNTNTTPGSNESQKGVDDLYGEVVSKSNNQIDKSSLQNLIYQKHQIDQYEKNITQLTSEISTQTQEIQDLQNKLSTLVDIQEQIPEYLLMQLYQKQLEQYESDKYVMSQQPWEQTSLQLLENEIAHNKKAVEELKKELDLQEIQKAKDVLDQKIKTLESDKGDLAENQRMKAELSREVQFLESYANFSDEQKTLMQKIYELSTKVALKG